MSAGLDRRGFLLAAGGVAGAALWGACGREEEPRPADETIVTHPDRLEGDLSVAALLVSLENLLIWLYQEGIDRRDRLGQIPPPAMALIESAQRQHKEHAAAWNSILTGAGKPAVTGLNLTVKAATTDPDIKGMREIGTLLSACQELETITAATYLAGLGSLQNNAAVKVAASIHPVENAHVTAIAFLLGRTPVPEAFGRVDGARSTSDSVG